MPYLIVDGDKSNALPQSLAIARYLAKKFGFAGKDELEQSRVDALVYCIADFQRAWIEEILHSKDKETTLKKFKEADIPLHVGRIEKLIGLYGSNGFAVGGALTFADLFLYDMAKVAVEIEPSALDNAPGISASLKSVEANEKLAAYLASRQSSTF